MCIFIFEELTCLIEKRSNTKTLFSLLALSHQCRHSLLLRKKEEPPGNAKKAKLNEEREEMVFCSSLLCNRKHMIRPGDLTDVADKASKARLYARPASE